MKILVNISESDYEELQNIVVDTEENLWRLEKLIPKFEHYIKFSSHDNYAIEYMRDLLKKLSELELG